MSEDNGAHEPRWLNRNIFGMGMASLFSDMNHEMATAVLPAFLSSVLGAPAFALGVIEGVADGISTIFQVWAGWYSDRIGKCKGLAAMGYFITAFSKASFALATSWWHVLFGRTVGWIGWSIRSPVRDALLVESTTPATVGRAFAFHRTLDTLGAILGPLIAWLLLDHVSIRTIFLVSLIPGLLAFLCIVLLVKEKARMPEHGNTWESLQNLPAGFRKFLLPVGIFGISNFAPTLLILRAQDLLTPDFGAAHAAAFAVGLYTFGNIVYALVAYPIGTLADRYEKKTILSIGFALFAIMCLGFILADAQKWALVLLFALNGIYTAIIESSQPVLASTLLCEHEHGTGYGAMSSVDGLGDFLSSITVGVLWSVFSPAIGFGFAATLALFAAVLLYGLRLESAN
ncbi:MAG: MFS transporter [Ferrovum myxofaciens]|uniref:MFS transporter n=1 Tax=Ferrovum myxofaciens TaxID=416213 RepID=UPI00235779C5|nr:MFS transporter [Ferrovum myxofaciens]QKE41944.1 MAG: MFS transporter [Ferrovum myxofaciens]